MDDLVLADKHDAVFVSGGDCLTGKGFNLFDLS